jgi:hypothetical protein
MKRSTLIKEPDLFFGGNEPSMDPKIGILNFGPYGSEVADDNPRIIRAGVIATKRSYLELESWLEKLRTRIPGVLDKESGSRDPDFPGLLADGPLKFDVQLDPSCYEEIVQEHISRLSEIENRKERVLKVIEIYEQKFKDLMETTDPKPDIVLLPISEKMLNLCKEIGLKGDRIVYEHRSFKKKSINQDVPLFDFHNTIKILAYKYGGFTTQLLLPRTLTFGQGTQDPATIGWNFAVSTYYKATGIPWKLADIDNETCYVGISFYQEFSKGERNMRASMAQVYLKTGESQVIRGKPFKWDGKTFSPQLNESQANEILHDVIDLYKRQKNGSLPKRIVIHKTSSFTDEEIKGFDRATIHIEMVDYIHILEDSGILMLPKGETYPAIRGTFVYENNEFLLYTTGYVPALDTYKGPTVPAPLFMRAYRLDTTPETIAKDVLALTKLDWNNSSFNTRMPVTISVSRKVGSILSESSSQSVNLPTNYRYYM